MRERSQWGCRVLNPVEPHEARIRPTCWQAIGPGVARLEGQPVKRAEAELLINCEEDRTLRAVLVGMLREMERR
jgi:hypothetical protein